MSFFIATALWVALLGIKEPSETLPKELGADDSTLALVSVTILVCIIAPLCEEFFFRGYFFTALRSWRGMWPAAMITGLVFGAIHAGSADPAFLVPLGLLGHGLCLLYVPHRLALPVRRRARAEQLDRVRRLAATGAGRTCR